MPDDLMLDFRFGVASAAVGVALAFVVDVGVDDQT